MKSFIDFGREHHLAWTRVEHHLGEDAGKPGGLQWPHLQDLPRHEYDDVIRPHEPTPEEEAHHEANHAKIRGTEALVHQRNYKEMSDVYNVPLRSAKRTGGGLIMKVHHYQSDDVARNYGMDLDRAHARHIDKVHGLEAVTDRPTSHDMHVYRGIYTQSGIHKLAPGRTFTDHGFTGTSFAPGIANSFAGHHEGEDETVPQNLHGRRIMAKIHVPAGSLGHYLDVDPNTPHHENEFLLHRGTHFRVEGHSIVNSGYHPLHVVHMSVIGNHPKELINPYRKQETTADRLSYNRNSYAQQFRKEHPEEFE